MIGDKLAPDATVTWDETALSRLLDLVLAQNGFELYGGSLAAYPKSDSVQSQVLYRGLQELERRGLVARKTVDDDFVIFCPPKETP